MKVEIYKFPEKQVIEEYLDTHLTNWSVKDLKVHDLVAQHFAGKLKTEVEIVFDVVSTLHDELKEKSRMSKNFVCFLKNDIIAVLTAGVKKHCVVDESAVFASEDKEFNKY